MLVLRAFGVSIPEQIPLTTDNKANLLVSTRHGSAARAKPLLRRLAVLGEALERNEFKLVHVPGENHPADFLTKWLPAKQFARALAWATGSLRRVMGK